MFKYLAVATIVMISFTSCKKTELEDVMIKPGATNIDDESRVSGDTDALTFGHANSEDGFESGDSGSFGTDGGDDGNGSANPNAGGNTGGGNTGGIIGGDENENDDDNEGGIIGGDEKEEDDDKEGKGKKTSGLSGGGSASGGLGSGNDSGTGSSGSTGGGI